MATDPDLTGTSKAPGLDCLVRGCILMDAKTADHTTIACWCLWCGGAAYDGDVVTDDGKTSPHLTISYHLRTVQP